MNKICIAQCEHLDVQEPSSNLGVDERVSCILLESLRDCDERVCSAVFESLRVLQD